MTATRGDGRHDNSNVRHDNSNRQQDIRRHNDCDGQHDNPGLVNMQVLPWGT
jgi:hypothetical protein